MKTADGVQDRSLVFDGRSLLTVKDSAQRITGNQPFTLAIWVNPYKIGKTQQMIAARHQYSLDQRNWGWMIDKDKRFRLYVWQGKWVTVDCDKAPEPGHWHLVAVQLRSDAAELWVNGEIAGSVPLKQPLRPTSTMLTFAGVNDDGHIRQNFRGALDQATWFDRELTSAEMKDLYHPVTATHDVPAPAKPVSLWDETSTLPTAAELPQITGVRFGVIKPYEFSKDGYRFLHGVALGFHQGRLYASFGHNQGGENTDTEQARVCHSDDDGQTWSEVTTMDSGDEPGIGVSHGVFHSHGGKFWAFHGAYSGTMQNVHTRAYLLDQTTGTWTPKGTVIEGGFWPMQQPIRMNDGNWIMSGLRVGNGNPAAVAISHGDDFTDWDLIVIPQGEEIGNMWGEATVFVDGATVVNLSRFGAEATALRATSDDYGRTWTASRPSNLPMATSKPYTGTLSTGQHYLVGTTAANNGGRRSPLTIAVTRPNETLFSKVFVIRHAVFSDGPGESHPKAKLSYPYAIEHAGNLYVGYSNSGGGVGRVGSGRELWNNNSAELAVIPIKSLTAP
ncbi:exo-alpha-sialidase [Novipirellula maiorica]|uniref:exo-alpha-sialidase n=1 Tax=Novipirellula maiorica TaxID=1265734 RepID=UPI001360B038|nr:exo-alpha-sialidase [Rhodopirellula maiorica]